MAKEALGQQCAWPASDQTAKMQGIFLYSPAIVLCCRFIQRVEDEGNGAGNEIDADDDPGRHRFPSQTSACQAFQLLLYFQPAHLGILDIIGKLRLTLEQTFQQRPIRIAV